MKYKITSFIIEVSSKSDALGFDIKNLLGQGRVHKGFLRLKFKGKDNDFPIGGLIPESTDVAWTEQKRR